MINAIWIHPYLFFSTCMGLSYQRLPPFLSVPPPWSISKARLVSVSSVPDGSSKHTRHRQRSIMSRESLLVESAPDWEVLHFMCVNSINLCRTFCVIRGICSCERVAFLDKVKLLCVLIFWCQIAGLVADTAYIVEDKWCLTFDQHAAGFGPLCSGIWCEQTDRRQTLLFSVCHLSDSL